MILVCFLALIIFGGLVYTLTLSPNGAEDMPQQTASVTEDGAEADGQQSESGAEGGEDAAGAADDNASAAPSGGANGANGTGAVGVDGEDAPGAGVSSAGTDTAAAGNAADGGAEAQHEAAETPSSVADEAEPEASGETADAESEQATAKPVAAAKPATTDYSKVALPYSYTVRKGDTLFRLSQLFYGSKSHVAEIASRNKLSKDAELTAGSVIVIPSLSKSQGGKASSPDKPAASGAAVVHTVKEGETLYSISRTYFGSNSYAKKIAAYNQLGDGDDVKVGTKLKIPPKSS